ncbi:hypothetical protein AMC86_PD00027 (plasmid) [Rhizobium phaseoli]|uniref:Uncharacterized protein n=1 Tax=Rhizobium phaseoli TaxID=396 RepID=A0ABM6CIZ7_9HYPH|nr:hypothetical protein AMC86_PD00027 [Rhizobium phaseoli]ANL88275.1 hypothetical protein AMC81_PE00027 [Rhizobium phaseoli]ANL94784.1 hypothetical protein AMC80_PE00027 [Rhizobium phaseoli]
MRTGCPRTTERSSAIVRPSAHDEVRQRQSGSSARSRPPTVQRSLAHRCRSGQPRPCHRRPRRVAPWRIDGNHESLRGMHARASSLRRLEAQPTVPAERMQRRRSCHAAQSTDPQHTKIRETRNAALMTTLDGNATLSLRPPLEPFLVRLKHSAGAGFRQARGDWRRAYPKVRPSRSPLILARDARPTGRAASPRRSNQCVLRFPSLADLPEESAGGLTETGRLIDRPAPLEPTECFNLTRKSSRCELSGGCPFGPGRESGGCQSFSDSRRTE